MACFLRPSCDHAATGPCCPGQDYSEGVADSVLRRQRRGVQFLDKVLAGPVLCNDSVDARGVVHGGFGKMPIISTSSCIWQCSHLLQCSCVSLLLLLEEFHTVYAKVCPGRSHMEIRTVSPSVWRFGLAVEGLFRRYGRYFSHSVQLDVECPAFRGLCGSPRWQQLLVIECPRCTHN